MKLKGGKTLAADGQLAGSPSVIFDAVALVLSEEGCAQLLADSAAIDFVHNAFVHLKAIGFTADAQPLLDKAGVVADAGCRRSRRGRRRLSCRRPGPGSGTASPR